MKNLSYTLAASCMLFGLPCSLHAVTDVSCYPHAVTPLFDAGSCGLEVELSALYLKPHLNHFIWSQELTNSSVGKKYSNELGHYRLNQVAWDWHAGYELEVGYRLPCSDWRLSIGWIGFEARDSQQLRAQATTNDNDDLDNGTLITLPSTSVEVSDLPNDDLVIISEVSGEFKLTYNELCLIARRASCLGKHLLFNPYTGLKALWLKEKIDADAHYHVTIIDNTDNNGGNAASDYYNDYRGVGITVGFEASYLFCCQLAIEGKFGCSLFYGSHRLRSEHIVQSDDPEADFPDRLAFFVEDREWCFIPQWEPNLGLAWYQPYSMDQGLFFASIGWEMRHLLNSFLAPSFDDSSDELVGNAYDLTLSGLRLTLGASF